MQQQCGELKYFDVCISSTKYFTNVRANEAGQALTQAHTPLSSRISERSHDLLLTSTVHTNYRVIYTINEGSLTTRAENHQPGRTQGER